MLKFEQFSVHFGLISNRDCAASRFSSEVFTDRPQSGSRLCPTPTTPMSYFIWFVFGASSNLVRDEPLVDWHIPWSPCSHAVAFQNPLSIAHTASHHTNPYGGTLCCKQVAYSDSLHDPPLFITYAGTLLEYSSPGICAAVVRGVTTISLLMLS